MKKKKVIIISSIVVVVLIIAGVCFMFNGKTDKSNLTNSPTVPVTEKEKYASFEAEFTCQLLGVTNGTEMIKILGSFENFTIEHGYTDAIVQQNVALYKDDAEFKQLAFNYMEARCPAKVQAAGLTQYNSAQA